MAGAASIIEEERMRRVKMWRERLPGGCYVWPPIELPDCRAEPRFRPAQPAQRWKCDQRLLRRAPFYKRQGLGLREFINKLPQINGCGFPCAGYDVDIHRRSSQIKLSLTLPLDTFTRWICKARFVSLYHHGGGR